MTPNRRGSGSVSAATVTLLSGQQPSGPGWYTDNTYTSVTMTDITHITLSLLFR